MVSNSDGIAAVSRQLVFPVDFTCIHMHANKFSIVIFVSENGQDTLFDANSSLQLKRQPPVSVGTLGIRFFRIENGIAHSVSGADEYFSIAVVGIAGVNSVIGPPRKHEKLAFLRIRQVVGHKAFGVESG